MNKRYFIIFTAVVLFITAFTNVNAQSSVKDKEDARAFVQKFYSWYTALYNKDTPKSDLVALKKYPEYFDTTLSTAITRDYTEQPKNAGEILGLDGDPFLNAQDTGFDYLPGDVTQEGSKFLIKVHAGPIGKSKEEILRSDVVIIPQVAKINGQWRFINFSYTAKDGGGNLLSVLANLRKERQEWITKHSKKSKSKRS
jgi:hypothetical protein